MGVTAEVSGVRKGALLLVAALTLLVGGCTSSEDRAKAHYDRGVELASAGEAMKASLEFRNALKLRSDYSAALVGLGKAEESLGHFDTAFAAYKTAADQDSANVEANVRIAYILVAGQQFDDALSFANRAMEISPSDPTALVAKAAVQLKRDNRGEAVQLARAALKEESNNLDALMVLASERLISQDPSGALVLLDQATGETDDNLALQVLRLTALDASGDETGVEQHFRHLISVFPDATNFTKAFVQWYLTKNRVADAETVLREAAARRPGDDNAQLELISFINEHARAGQALDELEALIAARRAAKQESFGLVMALARLQFSNSDIPSAITSMEALLGEELTAEQKSEARIQLARLYLGKGDATRAEELASAVLAEDATNVNALMVRASTRLIGGKADRAIEDLLAGADQAPDNADLRALLAQAYEEIGSVALAEEEYTKAANLDGFSAETTLPMARFLLRYGKQEQADRLLETARKVAPDNRDVLTLLAELKLSLQDWTGAQEIATALRTLDNGANDVASTQIRAAALSGLNRHDDSIRLLTASLGSNTSNRQVLPDLIRAYVRAGKQDAAMDMLLGLVAKNPNDAQAQILLGSVYLYDNKVDLAQKAFESAAASRSGGVGEAALAQFHLTRGNVEDAEAATRAGLLEDPQSTPLRMLLAAILDRQQRFDDAIVEYRALLAQNPQSAVVANNLASLLSERHGGKEALDEALAIAQRFATSEVPQYQDTLGWIYHLRGDHPEALRLLRQAASSLPSVAPVQYHLGVTLAALGENEQARIALRGALSITPGLIDADRKLAEEILSKATTPKTSS